MIRLKMTVLMAALSSSAFAQTVTATYTPPLPAQPTTFSVLLPHSYNVSNCTFATMPESGTPARIVTQIAPSNCTTLLKLDGRYYPIAGGVDVYAGQFSLAFPSTPARTCMANDLGKISILAGKPYAPAGTPLLFLSQYVFNMSTDPITFDVLGTQPQATVVINIKTQIGNILCTDEVQNPNDTIFKNGFQE